MASTAANVALATDVLAVQRLYYNITPNAAVSIFLLFSSQLLGYGIGGMLRGEFALDNSVIYPLKPCNKKKKKCWFIHRRCFIHLYFR